MISCFRFVTWWRDVRLSSAGTIIRFPWCQCTRTFGSWWCSANGKIISLVQLNCGSLVMLLHGFMIYLDDPLRSTSWSSKSTQRSSLVYASSKKSSKPHIRYHVIWSHSYSWRWGSPYWTIYSSIISSCLVSFHAHTLCLSSHFNFQDLLLSILRSFLLPLYYRVWQGQILTYIHYCSPWSWLWYLDQVIECRDILLWLWLSYISM